MKLGLEGLGRLALIKARPTTNDWGDTWPALEHDHTTRFEAATGLRPLSRRPPLLLTLQIC